MEVKAKISQIVNIDPKDVIKELIEEKLLYEKWIFEKDNHYYIGYYQGAGCHSCEVKQEISKELYDYIKALQLILETLNKNEK